MRRACGIARVMLHFLLPVIALGCASQSHGPAAEPQSDGRAVVSQPVEQSAQRVEQNGFSTRCPSGWKRVDKGGDYALATVPDGSGGGEEAPMVAIQVPALPPHIPGFLPLGGVADGYVQDLKKRYPDQKVDEKVAAKLDGADARRIVSSFQNRGKPWRELALLAVHGDHVYVMTGNCDASAFDKTKSAFDALAASLKWTQNK
jgi:hypothetical protein